MDLARELQAARENVARLQAQRNQLQLLLFRADGVAEYLAAKLAEEKAEAKPPKPDK